LVYLGLFFLSVLLSYIIKEYALKKSIIDIPNERSSHTIPTPRGGGLAIIITFYIGLFFSKESIPSNLFFALFSALPIVIISLLDDIKPISSKIRLLVQAISALLALYLLGGVKSIDFIWFELSGWWLNIFAFVSILWLTNLYNFLDGIDGYAASQTLMLGLGIFLLFSNSLGIVLAVASLGFLFLNWDKASIFMGDVGSATLGFIVAIFVFSDTSNGTIYFWLIGLSLFWYDATLTLFRRYKNKEKLTQAHRKHGYQRLVQSGWSHQKVSISLIIFNIVFFSLLYLIEEWEILFLFNMLILFLVMRYIDQKKEFQ